MAISMTRAEYETQYGVSPIFGAEKSKVDTSPSPTQMTSAEYKIRYGVDPFTGKKLDNTGIVSKIFTPAKEAFQGLKTLYGGGEQGIASKLKTDIQEGAKDIQAGNVEKGKIKAGFRVAGDVLSAIFAPIGAVLGATGANKGFEKFGQWYVDKFGEDLVNNPTFQKFAVEHPNAGEDFDRAMMFTMSAFDTSKIEPKTAIERTKTQIKNIELPKINLIKE